MQVDSITETSALHQEAYILFYVKQGMFPWFSSLIQEANSGAPSATVITNPERPKRHNVFAFQNLGEEDTHLVPKHKVKKSKATSGSIRGMMTAQRHCLLDCTVTKRLEQESLGCLY